MRHEPRAAAGLLAVYVVLVAAIVFWPTADVASASVSRLFSLLASLGSPSWISTSVIEFALNVLLFVPLSFLGLLWRPDSSWRTWVLIGVAGTLVIETAQLVLLSGRSATVVDVVSNTVGVVIGAFLGIRALRLSAMHCR